MTSAASNLPDLSLQIRPPSPKPTRSYNLGGLINNYMGTHDHRTDSGSSGGSSDLSHETSCHGSYLSLGLEMVSALNPTPPRKLHHYQPHRSTSNGVMKRNGRAPRMRWTSTLHSHFVHAVDLLGGHQSTHIYILILSLSYISTTIFLVL